MLGQLPATDEPAPNYKNLTRIEKGVSSDRGKLRLDYTIATMKCPLVACWSANLVQTDAGVFLQLPQYMKMKELIIPSQWQYGTSDEYPSNELLVRDCYVDIANAIFANVNANAHKNLQQMIVSGTPGTGKSFFAMYFIWRLLHPDGELINDVPEAIVYYDNPASSKGWIYHRGHFFKSNDLRRWLSLDECDEMLDNNDCWLIYDGAIPPEKPRCKTLVVTSPGNLSKAQKGAKAFHESTEFEIYFPTWSFDECELAARRVFKCDDAIIDKIRERYILYGGVPRFVLEWQKSKPKANPLGNAIASADIHKAVNDLGSSAFDHQQVSGKLIHLIPDTDYRSFTYEWASTHIMELCFDRLFTVTKTRIQCLLNSGQGLHMGSLYGILFEPWFHRKISEQGLNVKIRPLGAAIAQPRKRKLLSFDQEKTMKWPVQQVARFLEYKEIQPTAYNIPHVPNFSAVDSFSPSRGELFQITSAENHEIKVAKLGLLKPYFKSFLETGEKARLYFVVPPYRYQSFRAQRYVYPVPVAVTPAVETTANAGTHAAPPVIATVPIVGETPITRITRSKAVGKAAETKTENPSTVATATAVKPPKTLVNEPPDWIEQWVMELDVNPLSAALRASSTVVPVQSDANRPLPTFRTRLLGKDSVEDGV